MASHPLDNPIWQALTTSQAQFAEIHSLARRFSPEISSLGAFPMPARESYDSLACLLDAGEEVALFLQKPSDLLEGWKIVAAAPLLQMIHEDCETISSTLDLIELTERDVPEMMALAELTKPGPFGPRTRELGVYLGIRQAGKLVSMSGERLRPPGYSEISAVCTHPDHTGKGYARALMATLINRIRKRGDQPFLHVKPGNERAISLYKQLGFRERQIFHYVIIRKGR